MHALMLDYKFVPLLYFIFFSTAGWHLTDTTHRGRVTVGTGRGATGTDKALEGGKEEEGDGEEEGEERDEDVGENRRKITT